MKKNFFIAAFASTVFAGAFFLYTNHTNNSVRDLMLDNIEALANGEGSGSCSATATCYTEEYNSDTQKWEKIPTGSVSCTGTESCSSGKWYVVCDGNTSSCV